MRVSPCRPATYFFYGTLMDAEVRIAVMGGGAATLPVEAASLAGYRRLYMHGASYPVLVPADGPDEAEPVTGLLVDGIGAEEGRRLRRFEGSAYRLETVTVEGRWRGRTTARCFLPTSVELADPRPWDFATWRRRDRSRYLSRIRRLPIAAG